MFLLRMISLCLPFMSISFLFSMEPQERPIVAAYGAIQQTWRSEACERYGASINYGHQHEETVSLPNTTDQLHRFREQSLHRNRYLAYLGHRQHPSEYSYRFTITPQASQSLIGLIDVVTQWNGSYGHVIGLEVNPEFRRQGYGRRLLQAACAFFTKERVQTAVIAVETPEQKEAALALYQSEGFERDAAQRGHVLRKNLR